MRGAERNQLSLVEEEAQMGAETAFMEYGHTLEMVMSFQYLCCLLTATDADYAAVIGNIQKTRWSFSCLLIIMCR